MVPVEDLIKCPICVCLVDHTDKRGQQKFRGSIKGPITIPENALDYLTVLSMPQVSFEFL